MTYDVVVFCEDETKVEKYPLALSTAERMNRSSKFAIRSVPSKVLNVFPSYTATRIDQIYSMKVCQPSVLKGQIREFAEYRGFKVIQHATTRKI